MAGLFDPIAIRGLDLRNRIVMPPMCQYSCFDADGRATDWHVLHIATRAVGGVGLCIVEATAVEPRGRISRQDLGLWDDCQIKPLARVVNAAKAHGGAVAVQLAHAGRKADSSEKGHWDDDLVGPSALAFDEQWRVPRELGSHEIEEIAQKFADAARRAAEAGFDAVEIHGAHGYLISSFLSPLANARQDEYGGSLENRARLALRVTSAVRRALSAGMPVIFRISGTDFVEGGTTIEDSVQVARMLKAAGADVIDVSGGGNASSASPLNLGFPGYMVEHSAAIRRGADVMTMAVGLITLPAMADEVIRNGRADLVALGRQLLREPYWPLRAARELGVQVTWPKQYERARL